LCTIAENRPVTAQTVLQSPTYS